MIISAREQEDINRLYKRLKEQGGGRKEDYFGLMYLGRKFKGEPEDLIHHVAIGEHPYGINGYFVDNASRNLYLFCFKWTEKHTEFRDALEQLAAQGMEAVFGNALTGASNNALITRLRADLYEHKAVIDRIFIQLVFKGSADAAEQSAGLQERREAVENKRYLVDSYFGNRQVDLVVEYVADKRIAVAPPPASYTIDFEETVATEMSGDRRLHVGFVRLIQLVEMYKAFGQRFLDRNIRAGLSPEKSPNRHIREALAQIVMRRIDEPEVFSFNHNGVTLSAEEAHFSKGTATLKVPRLLNGAQTITSVAKFLTDNADSVELKSGRQRLDRIRVLAKLIEFKPRGKDDDFIATITVCNNRQNAVEPWNLRANDRIQCDLQDKLREDLRIFYSRQEKSFENLSEEDLEELNIADTKDIRIKPLAQTFLAVQGEVDRMSRLPDVFETQKTYLDTFRESYLKVDSRRIVLAYKVGLVLNSPVKRMTTDAPQWLQPAMPKARNLIWALLIQGLFNDHRCAEYLDQFGTSLVKESLFRNLAATVGANRILPVFRAVFVEDSFRRKIEEEKYAFLRTKEVFRRCADVAAIKYDWSKLSL